MKKKDFLKLVNESIHEVLVESGNRIDPKSLKQVRRALGVSKILSGNERVDKKERGLQEIVELLHKIGYELGMVSGNTIMGEKGSVLIPYRKSNVEGQDIFTDQPDFTNSMISYSWELLSPGRYEIIAYAT